MAASCFAQVMQQLGDSVPDVDSADDLKAFFAAIGSLNRACKLLAYHDRSDGGLFTTWPKWHLLAAAGCRLISTS